MEGVVEGLVKQSADQLITQGSGWIVSVLLGIVIWLMYKRNEKFQAQLLSQADAANLAVKDQYEKRLAEFRELLDVVANSTNTINGMHSSLKATTDAINQLVVGFAKLLQDFQSQQTRWDDRGGNMARQLDDIRQRVESLQRGVAA